ncbi:MAG: phosphatidylglycerophosphatase A [Bdellovibrionales bacterium]|nr:phosphatidylglycerophosphatase A [Bdellovibrionales bacterium]
MILRFYAAAFATLGVGKIPKAPGTFGSALAVFIWWQLSPQPWQKELVWLLLAFIFGFIATQLYEKNNHKHDPKEVVVDELIGMWIALFAVPPTMTNMLFAFLLFRLFDIWKPFPVGWLDRKVPGALGTILDDVAAGLIARFLLQLLIMMEVLATMEFPWNL